MDQDSSNGASPDKRNWRERLGIGTRELPKLSEEFREGGVPPREGAPRAAQPVVKPAPMAPRLPRKPAEPVAASDRAPPPAAADRPAPAAAPSRAIPKAPDKAAQDSLAEKLRAQRAAAERLAEQRVQAARQRADAKAPPPAAARPLPPLGAATRQPGSPSQDPRPRFTFADENRSGGDTGGKSRQAPLVPPRQALGGERGQPPFLRPSAAGSGAAREVPPYRSGEPGLGSGPRLKAPVRPSAGPGTDSSGYGANRLPPRRPPATDLYARRPEPRDFARIDETDRAAARPGRSAAPGLAPAREEFDDLFEDDAPPRRSAATREYPSGYEDEGEVFADEQRRSSGPWLLLLALLMAAIGLGALFWLYSDSLRGLSGAGGSVQPADTVPVVKAPEEPAKVEPEAAPATEAEAPAQQKKQIYDRIVGDQEVPGDAAMQPTEELPVPPEQVQPVGQVPEAQPLAPANQIPAPDALDQSTTGQGLPELDQPPPLPPPPPDPSGQQGSLQQPPAAQVAAASAPPEQGSTAAPRAAAGSPPQGTATDGAALITGTAAAVDNAASQRKKPEQPTAESAETVQAPPPKKKTAAAKKKVKQENPDNLGSEPVVLVPPSQAPAAQEQFTASAPPVEAAPQPAPPKRKTIFNIFDRNGSASPAQNDQVASLEQPAPRTSTRSATQTAPSGGGYVVQLSSFRSQSDAQREYARLKGDFPNTVGGLPQQIRQTTVAGSTRFQLALGPVGSRSAATKVCRELIAAGEADCIVRGP